MTQEQALIPQFITQRGNQTLDNILSVVSGVFVLSLLAQIAIPLPWTPVPITGQTFGVALTALMWGRKRGCAVVLAYLGVGAIGLPVFALGGSGFSFGPTTGYLIGMVFASYWMGYLADTGYTKTFWRFWFAALSGSLVIFLSGVFVLSFFIPTRDLVTSGILPFLPGDFFKTLLSSSIAYHVHRALGKKS